MSDTLRILVADIGGTNSRFAIFSARPGGGADTLEMGPALRIPTQSATSFADLLARLEGRFSPGESDVTVLAVPGAVRNRTFARPPNIPWEIDATGMRTRTGAGRFFLVNDFVAQGFACRTPALANARLVKAGQPQDDAALAAVGAGTGLGHCALLPVAGGGWVAAPSEAGHASLALGKDAQEEELRRFVLARTGLADVYNELLVSGPGLALLHEFLTGRALDPAQVAAELPDHPETEDIFARLYGRVCRNYALTVLALAGVFVMGGVAAKNPRLVDNDAFRNEFVASARYGWLLEAIPVRLNANEDSGLWGAACFGLLQTG